MKKEVPTRALRTLMLVLLVALALSAPAGTPLASVTGTVTAKAATETSVKSLSKGKSYTLSGYAKVTSSDKSIATATKKSTKKYTITGVKKGTATLKCYDSDGKLVKKIYLIVTTSSSLKYDTSTVVLAKGKTKTVTATVQSGCTVKYSSSKTSVATVNSKGKITAKKTGTATISAKVYYKGTKIKTFKKTVAVVSYDTSAVTLTAGKSKTVAAKVPSGYAVSYSSSDKSVASVSSAGKITAKKAGTATITAKISYDGEVLKKLTKKITVTSASGTSSGSTASSVPALTYTFDTSAVTIAPGKTLSVKATVSDGYTVSYSSSDKSVATVSSSGVVTGVTEGAAAITVEISYNGTLKKTLTKKVTVAAPALTYTFDTSDATISPGKTLSVKASATTGYSVAYSSSDSSVATVSSSGVVTGVKGGTATINVKLSYNGTVKKTLAKSVTVRSYQLSSSSLSLDVNGTSTASLTCAPASGDTGDGDTFAWSSSDTSVATVDPDIETGSVKAVAAGTATITCRVNDTVALTCKVTVTKTFKNYANFCGSGTNYAGSNSIAGGRSGALVAWCEKASDAVTLEFSNDNLQIGDIEGPTAGYDQPNDMTGYCWYIYIYGRKKGTCDVSVYINGNLLKTITVTITSTDTYYYDYIAWKAELKAQLWTDDMSDLEKIVTFGDYVFGSQPYSSNHSPYGYAQGYGGSCWASQYLLVDLAHDLGYEAEVIFPYYEYNLKGCSQTHAWARIYIGNDVYVMEASNSSNNPYGYTGVSKMN